MPNLAWTYNTLVAALQAHERFVAVVPAARALREVTAQRRQVTDLRRREAHDVEHAELRIEGEEHRRDDGEVLRDVVGDRERGERPAGDQQLLADLDHLDQLGRVAVQVHHIAGLFGRLRARVHRDGDVGLGVVFAAIELAPMAITALSATMNSGRFSATSTKSTSGSPGVTAELTFGVGVGCPLPGLWARACALAARRAATRPV